VADTRTDMITAMGSALEGHYDKVPSSIPITVPLGKLADAAIAALAGRTIPSIPRWEEDLSPRLKWAGTTEDIVERLASTIAVRREIDTATIESADGKYVENVTGVVITATGGSAEEYVLVDLNRTDAIAFALNILAAAEA